MQAVILAGGKGRRLLPYTTVLPKPLMPIGEYPIIEVILRQLKRNGFTRITICTGYLHELIHAYLDTNRNIDMRLEYTHEQESLGTIGPLRLIENLDDTFLVMNGDILTDIDYQSLFKTHKKSGAINSGDLPAGREHRFRRSRAERQKQDHSIPGETDISFRCQHGDLCFLQKDP